jgi:hypothetical protein
MRWRRVAGLLADGAREVRAASFRVLRLLVDSERTAALVLRGRVDVALARSYCRHSLRLGAPLLTLCWGAGRRALVRDVLLDSEREQALRLIRACLAVPGTLHLPCTERKREKQTDMYAYMHACTRT